MTAYEAIVHGPLEYPPWEAFLLLVCAGWPMRMAWAFAQGGTPVGPPKPPDEGFIHIGQGDDAITITMPAGTYIGSLTIGNGGKDRDDPA